jgi:uncharacterized protein YecT (DUF1311 family)
MMTFINKFCLITLLLLPVFAQAKPLCPQSTTTVEMNQCLSVKLERAVNELENKLDLIRSRYADMPALLQTIENAQLAWEAYRKKQCQSVYLMYEGGSIQPLMTASCSIQLARERNQLLQETYLSNR